jgi:flagellar protein FlgJ
MMDAMQRVEGFKVGRETSGGQPVQVASNDPQFIPASAPAQDVAPQPPMQEQPQQVAQAQSQSGPSPQFQKAMQVYANPWATPEQKQMSMQVISQEMQRQDPKYQMEMQAAQQGLDKGALELDQMRNPQVDPMKQVQLEQERIKLQQLQNPSPEYDFITGKDGSVFRADKTSGKMDTVYGAQPDQVKPTADIQEYEYAKNQGFQGTFPEYQTAIKKAGASQVNIDQKAEGAFGKKLAEGQAETFNTMATDGMNARAEIGLVNQLEGLMQGQGGMGTGLATAAGKWGLATDGMSDLQAADAIISKLVPSQRQPGSGSMSDRDVELFKSSLPSLWNQPGGNTKIIQTMRGLSQYKQAQGEIAQAVQMDELSRQDAVKALKALPNPLAEFGTAKKNQGQTKSGLKWSAE